MFFYVIIIAPFVIALIIMYRMAQKSVKNEHLLMMDLNKGHRFWCRAGVEHIDPCTCDTQPYLTVNDMDERFRKIRQTTAKLT